MSPLLKKSFDSSKCKTLLQLMLQRIKILRNKHSIVAKQSRDDVAKLLEKGQDGSARVRVEHIFREENIVAAYDLLEQYCQLIVNRIETIKSQKKCPSDLKEAIASLIYAAQRCGDLQELQKVQELFTSKYGTEFSVAAKELRPDCGVNTQIIKNLSSLPPNPDTKLKLLKEIAVERKIDWDYEKAAAGSFKGAGDVLDGPKHFVSASQVFNVDMPAVADKQKPVSISMHPDGLKGQASSVFHNAIASPASPLKAKMSSLDPSPHNVHQIANHEINTTTESKAADHAVRALKASAKTDTGGRKEDQKSPGNSGVHLKPDHGTPSPKLDPYALAKAEGKMDYKNVFDFMGQAQETEKVFKGMELKQEGRDTGAYDKYAKQQTGGAQDRTASKDAPNHEDVSSPHRSKEKGEGSRNHITTSPQTKHRAKESTSENEENRSTLQELSEEKFIRRTSIVLSEITQERMKPPELTWERIKAEPEFLDLETAAEVAFVSAARAAEAAKAAIDMVRMNSIGSSGKKMVDGNSLQRGQYLKSSFGSGKRENHTVTEGTSKGMDSEHSFERELYSHVNNSMVHHEVLGHSSSDTIEDAFKYVESEKLSCPQKYIQTSTHAEMLNTKAEAHAISHVWDEATQHPRNYPDWLGTCDLEHEEASSSHELGSKEAFINTSIRRVSELYSEGVKKYEPAQTASSSRKQESSSDHTELHQEEKYVQCDSLVPQFDDYNSDESSEEEPPFYMKGRPAMAREDYGQVAERASFNKPKWSMSTFRSFIEQGSDDYVDESSNSIIQRNAQQESLCLYDYAESVDVFSQKSLSSPYQHSNLVTNSIQSEVQEHSQNPQFDDYAESVDLSNWSSKSPVRSHTSDVNTGFRSEGLIMSPTVDNDSYHKLTTRRKLRWHSSTSEESDFYSQSDEVSPTLSSVKLPSCREGESGYGGGDLASQANRKLRWRSLVSAESDFPSEPSLEAVSEELDFPSKPSLEAGKLRWNSTTSEEFNSQPSLEARKLKPSSHNEDEARTFKQGHRPGTTTQVTQASTGKSYYGLSRRSPRSSRPNVLPPTSGYESTNSPSIGDENYHRYR